MRIAICTDSFLPVVDGVGRVTYEYARRLSARGHECYVITPIYQTGYRGGYPFEIVDYLSVAAPTAAQYRAGVATLDPHYLERVRSMELDLVHVHSPGTAGIEGLRLSLKHKIPLIGTFHSKYYDDIHNITHSELLSAMGAYTVAGFYERCDEVWTVSRYAAGVLHSYGYDGDIQVMKNGCEARERKPENETRAREAFSLTNEPILLYVGQIDEKKNLTRILEAAALLQERGREFQLVFAGQGKDRKRLEEKAKELGVHSMVFTGHILDIGLLDGLYMAASLFVFPSLYDTAGLVVCEAAAMGTVSVVTENSAPAEMIRNKQNGLLCADSAAALADAIEQYVYMATDEDRIRMEAAAAKTLPIPWDGVMDMAEARYRALLAKPRPEKRQPR